MKLRHPNILPTIEIDVTEDRVASHLAAGWLPVADEAPTAEADPAPDTTHRPRRRRAGSDSTKETAA